MDSSVTRAEFEQFQELMKSENEKLEQEDRRQNERIKDLETTAGKLWEFVGVIKELATNMQNMAREQEKQGQQLKDIAAIAGEISRVNAIEENQKKTDERLKAIEEKPGKRWDNIVDKLIWLVVGAVGAFFLGKLGL